MDRCESFLTEKGLKALKEAEKTGVKLSVKYFKASGLNYNFDDVDADLEYYCQSDLSGYTYTDSVIDFLIDIPPENAADDARFFAIFLEDSTPLIYARPYGELSKNKRQKTCITLRFNNARELFDFKYIPFAAAGRSLISEKGLQALSEFTLSDKKLPLKYFKVSDKEYDLSRSVTDIDGWYQNDINAFLPVDDNTIEFVVDVPPEKAKYYGKTFALFLEDGTLFMLAKPPAPFPPLFRQVFRIQFVYENANNSFDFKYIPFSDVEKVFSALDVLVGKGLETNKIWEKINSIEQSSSFSLDARENLSEIDKVKARYNLNIYSKEEVDGKIARLEEGDVITNVDKVDGRDVDDAKNDYTALWTAAKINECLNRNTIYCEYYKKKADEPVKDGKLVRINKDGFLVQAGLGESFIGVAINKNEFSGKANLVIATGDKSSDDNYVLVSFTGYIGVRCLEDVSAGDYIAASRWKGIGGKALSSDGVAGFKRLLAVQDLDYIGTIGTSGSGTSDSNVKDDPPVQSEDMPIPDVIKIKDFISFMRKIKKEETRYLKSMYKLENMQRILKSDIEKADIEKIKKIFDENGFSYETVEKKKMMTEEVKVKRVLALLM